jgi:hypothetical protein
LEEEGEDDFKSEKKRKARTLRLHKNLIFRYSNFNDNIINIDTKEDDSFHLEAKTLNCSISQKPVETESKTKTSYLLPIVNINIKAQKIESNETNIFLEGKADSGGALNNSISLNNKENSINLNPAKLNEKLLSPSYLYYEEAKNSTIQNNNLNISIEDSPALSDKSKQDSQRPPNSPSKVKWRKLSNIISTINCFHRYDTKNIGDEVDIDKDLKDYKSRLHGNTVRSRFFEGKQERINMDQLSKEDYEDQLRQDILSIIIE